MTDLTVGHIQYRLIRQFDYDLWFRTICDDGEFSEWTGPYYLERYTSEEMKVSPNPTYSSVQFDGIVVMSVEVYDLTGNKVLQTQVYNNQLNLNSLRAGTYKVRIQDVNNKFHNSTIIKK